VACGRRGLGPHGASSHLGRSLTDWRELRPAEAAAADAEMIVAAREWLTADGDADAESQYIDRWIRRAEARARRPAVAGTATAVWERATATEAPWGRLRSTTFRRRRLPGGCPELPVRRPFGLFGGGRAPAPPSTILHGLKQRGLANGASATAPVPDPTQRIWAVTHDGRPASVAGPWELSINNSMVGWGGWGRRIRV
jgi:hypothetical protein